MTDEDLPPELWADDEPRRERPFRSRVIKAAGLIAIVALVLPGVLVTWSTWEKTADYACTLAVQYYAPSAEGAEARFDVSPLRALGWSCYALTSDGRETRVASLGPIPGAPELRPRSGS